MKFKKVALPIVLILGIVCLFTVKSLKTPKQKTQKESYADFINNHPYANRDIDLDQINKLPKQDRPDLAFEHNFLQIVDPQLQRIPSERLVTSFAVTKEKLRSKRFRTKPGTGGRAAIEDVVWTERGPNNVGGRTRALMWDPNDPTSTKVWAGATSGGIWFNNDITDANESWEKVDDFLGSLSISSLTYDPNNTTTFYAGTGEGIIAGNSGGGVPGAGLYKSADGGNTWELLPSTGGPNFRYIQKVLVTPTGTLLVTTRQSINEGGTSGIYRSIDGGENWTRVVTERAVDLQLAANGDVYASTGLGSGSGKVWRSIDDGINWTEKTPPGGNPLWIELAIAPSQSSETASTRLYAVAQNASDRITVTWFQRSDDGGDTWTDLDIPRYFEQNCSESTDDFTRGQAFYDLILAVQPDNADVVTLGGITIYRSTNAGVDMEQVSYWTGGCDAFVHADQHEAVFRPGFPNEAVFGHDGGVSYSPDVGDPTNGNPSFVTRNNNYSVTQFYAMAARNEAGSNNLLAGAQDNGTQRFSDANGVTTNMAVGGDGAFCHIDQEDGNFQIASIQFNSVRHSSDGGGGFRGLTSQNTSHPFITPSDLDNASHTLYTAAAPNQYMYIADINTAVPADPVFNTVPVGIISHINADSKTANRLYIGTTGGDVFIIDNANSASPVVTEITNNIFPSNFFSSSANISSISIGSSDDQLLVTISNFGMKSVWLTVDGGDDWISKDETSHGLPDMPVRWSIFNPLNTNEVLLATELGVWSTSDILAENPGWEPTSTNLANVRCDMLQYREADGNVFVATFGRGVFSTDAFAGDLDNEAPVIVSLSPSAGEVDVPSDVTLEVVFNEAVAVGTGNISIVESSNDSVFETIDVTSSNVSISGATVSISLTNALASLTSYYVTIDNGAIQDVNDNAFTGIADKNTWSFTSFDGDFPPEVVMPIGSVLFPKSTQSSKQTFDLSEVFNDPDAEEGSITYSITENTNPSFIEAAIEGSTLTLTTLMPSTVESTSITIQASSSGKSVEDTFTASVSSELLVNQTDNGSADVIISMQMTDKSDTLIQLADDFSVPEGERWDIFDITVFGVMSNPEEGRENEAIRSFGVQVYTDHNGAPNDDELVFDQEVIAPFVAGQQSVRLSLENLSLPSGHYWLSIYAISPLETARWNWRLREKEIKTDGEWHLNDRKGFFGPSANEWLSASSSISNLSNRDLMFSIEGGSRLAAPTDLDSERAEGDSILISWSVPEFIDTYAIDISTDNFDTFFENFEDSIFSGPSSIKVNIEEIQAYQIRVRSIKDGEISENSEVLSLAIEDLLSVEKAISFEVFPNPAQNELTIQFSDLITSEKSMIMITSVSGKNVLTAYKSVNGTASLDVSSLNHGIYILNVSVKGQTYSTRFIKQ